MCSASRVARVFVVMGSSAFAAACGSSGSTAQAGAGGGPPDTDANADGSSSASGGSSGSGGASGSGGKGGLGGSGPLADAGPCTLAKDWKIVDDYAHPGALNTNPSELFATPDGPIYGAGFSLTNGIVTGLLRSSATGGTFTLVKSQAGIGGDLAVAPDGTLFVSGGSDDLMGRSVRRSKDGGQTFQVVDTVPLTTGACNTGYVAITSTGAVYSAGSCDTEGWRVRVSADGGDTWDDVPESAAGASTYYQLEPSMPARLADVHVDGANHVFVSGTGVDAQSVSHWIVRRLDAGGFVTVEDFQLEAGKSTTPPTLSGTERVFATGSAEAADGKHWVVRRADATGANFTTIDSFLPASSKDAVGASVYASPTGTLVSVGNVTDANDVLSLLTRTSTDDGKTWSSDGGYTYAPGKSTSSAGSLVVDRVGNVYGAVRAVAVDAHPRWVVRRLECLR